MSTSYSLFHCQITVPFTVHNFLSCKWASWSHSGLQTACLTWLGSHKLQDLSPRGTHDDPSGLQTMFSPKNTREKWYSKWPPARQDFLLPFTPCVALSLALACHCYNCRFTLQDLDSLTGPDIWPAKYFLVVCDTSANSRIMSLNDLHRRKQDKGQICLSSGAFANPEIVGGKSWLESCSLNAIWRMQNGLTNNSVPHKDTSHS